MATALLEDDSRSEIQSGDAVEGVEITPSLPAATSQVWVNTRSGRIAARLTLLRSAQAEERS